MSSIVAALTRLFGKHEYRVLLVRDLVRQPRVGLTTQRAECGIVCVTLCACGARVCVCRSSVLMHPVARRRCTGLSLANTWLRYARWMGPPLVVGGCCACQLTQLWYGCCCVQIPTIGFNVETIDHNGYRVTMWDIGGCDKIRPLWRHYFAGTTGTLFFIDAADRDRLPDAVFSLGLLLSQDSLAHVPFAILVNKSDLPHAMTVEEVRAACAPAMGADGAGRCEWFRVVAPTADGLPPALDWLCERMASGTTSAPAPAPAPGGASAPGRAPAAAPAAESESKLRDDGENRGTSLLGGGWHAARSNTCDVPCRPSQCKGDGGAAGGVVGC